MKKVFFISVFVSIYMYILLFSNPVLATRSATWEETCNGNVCTRILYSGTMFVKDNGEWKSLTEISNVKWENGGFNFSYRNYWVLIEPFIIYNGQYKTVQDIKNAFPNVNIKDYIQLKKFHHKFALNYSNVPQNMIDNVDFMGFKLKDSGGLTWNDVRKAGSYSIVIKDKVEINYYDLIESHFTLNLVNKTYLLIGNISNNSQNGVIYLDPVIKLQDNATENIDDCYTQETQADTVHDTYELEVGGGAGAGRTTFIKFNITSIPANKIIDEGKLCVYEWYHWADVTIESYHVYNHTWTETTLTWNTHDMTRNSTASDSVSSTGTGWHCWDVTRAVEKEYDDGDKNVSIMLNFSGSPTDYVQLYARENPTNKPYLNVTYSLYYPTWFSNQSSIVSTYDPNTVSEFNITWNVSQTDIDKVFIELNHTGTPTNYTMTNDTYGGSIYNFTAVIGANSGNQQYWKSFANTTDDAWNSSDTWTFTINVATNPVNLYLNGTKNSNKTYTYPESVNATGTTTSGTVYLYRDNVLKASGNSPQSEEILLGNGTYAYKVNSTGNVNYTDNSTGLTFYALILKNSSSSTILTVTPNSSVDTNTLVTAVCYWNVSNSESSLVLYRDNYDVTSAENNTAVLLSRGIHNYSCFAKSTENYTSAENNYSLTVTQVESGGIEGGGGGDFIADTVIVHVSGNWTLLKHNAFLIMSANSTVVSHFTIDNKESINITRVEITCSSEHDLCKYVFFEDIAFMENIPLLETFKIPPGKTADITYRISLPEKPNLKPLEIYDIVLMIKIGDVQRPFRISIWYMPGGMIIAGGLSWFSNYTFGIPNWVIFIGIIIFIIIIIILATEKRNRPKWYKLIKR